LIALGQLRQRAPSLGKQQQAVESKLEPLEMAAVDQAKYLPWSEHRERFGPR
jgi:hypothetical protein